MNNLNIYLVLGLYISANLFIYVFKNNADNCLRAISEKTKQARTETLLELF